MENILLLNLLGKRFHVPHRLVADHPQTLLGNEQLLTRHYRRHSKDYYFERNPLLFPYILTYYTLERKIFCPHHIPVELLEKECQFFQLDHPYIYHELNKNETYQYFSTGKASRRDFLIQLTPFLAGLAFMLLISAETLQQVNESSRDLSWSWPYFLELFTTLLLTTSVGYQLVVTKAEQRRFLRNPRFLLDLSSTLVSIVVVGSQNWTIIGQHRLLTCLIMALKIARLFIVVGHLRILRLILLTFIRR